MPKRPSFFAVQYGYTFPSTLSSFAAATAYIQRRALLHLKKKEVMKLPGILATCVGEIHWTDKHSNKSRILATCVGEIYWTDKHSNQ